MGERHGHAPRAVREHNSPAVPGSCGVKPMEPAGLPVDGCALILASRLP
ncbi:hypothetical protein [Streptomyces sp. CBMA156]|nr:hypothetical protein [Streptomyces sp. CBMA156]